MSQPTTRPVSGLSAMKLDELKSVASSMGITGIAKMRKSDLVDAIKARQSGGPGTTRTATATARAGESTPAARTAESTPVAEAAGASTPAETPAPAGSGRSPRRATRAVGTTEKAGKPERTETPEGSANGTAGEKAAAAATPDTRRDERTNRAAEAVAEVARNGGVTDGAEHEGGRRQRERQVRREQDHQGGDGDRRPSGQAPSGGRRDAGQTAGRDGARENGRDGARDNGRDGARDGNREANRDATRDSGHQNGAAQGAGRGDHDDEQGSRRSRNRQRSRDRKRGRERTDWSDAEPQVGDDDILVPIAGILDVLENYAFVRTTGYLPGPDDVYVPLGMVKKHGLRKGDAVTGAVKALREGEQPTGNVGRQKYNALVRLDSVNGLTADDALTRVEFETLTPLHPQERLRLETTPDQLTTRVIDLVAPIGKGQRGLVIAPTKAGTTTLLQAVAGAITTNNPECHLMVVLVDERPEEVTEMQRAVKGEVIASTFDRPAEDQTMVAELAIERAKRLVELGHDVVVLIDSITALGRAYNLSAPAGGRVLPGGVDSGSLHPPKRLLGAARNIENGGSLTIIAAARVGTGSKMDEVIFEELTETATTELRLDGALAADRVFPAVLVTESGTRHEDALLSPEELTIHQKLRTILGGLEPRAAVEQLTTRLRQSRTNYEFLVQVQQSNRSTLV